MKHIAQGFISGRNICMEQVFEKESCYVRVPAFFITDFGCWDLEWNHWGRESLASLFKIYLMKRAILIARSCHAPPPPKIKFINYLYNWLWTLRNLYFWNTNQGWMGYHPVCKTWLFSIREVNSCLKHNLHFRSWIRWKCKINP